MVLCWTSHIRRMRGGKIDRFGILFRKAACASKRENRDGLNFMTDNLLSMVRGRKGHFMMESGHHGDLWFQLETLCLHTNEIKLFAVRLAAQLAQHEIELVCGPLV